jgi:hypothetical protein
MNRLSIFVRPRAPLTGTRAPLRATKSAQMEVSQEVAWRAGRAKRFRKPAE